MNKEYKIKLDLNKKLYNRKMVFNQFDENVNDFYIEVTKNNEVVKDLDKSIVTLVAIKPNGTADAQFIEVKEGQIYADLKPSMCDLVGNYQAKAMIVLEGKIITTDTIIYSVNEDKIISRLNEDVVSDERFALFTDALARLSDIEASEEQRIVNEAERILSEENRKTEEAKRVEAELIRQHEEADRSKYDAIRESNENIRKQNESIRLANEANRIDEETKRVDEETKRVEAEQLRKDNYNFMTEDEERRRLEANAHKEAEVLRVQAETNRVNEEAKRRTTEQARVSAENTRVNNENTRKANETTRQNNETKRVEAETQRQSRYNSFIADAEANANNFENYTNNAKVKEEERKSNELDRKSQEARRVSNEVERISNENTRKANEKAREKNETSRQNIFENKADEVDKKIIELNTIKDNFVSSINTKVDTKISELDNTKSDMTNTVTNKIDEVENRFNALTSKQQQDAEVIDARDGETSLKARLDRDIEKAKQVYVNVKGSHISTDSSVGYLKDVEILGNTIQSASNLADIRSVGDTVEGQELYEIPVVSCGKNLFNDKLELGALKTTDGESADNGSMKRTASYVKVKPNTKYVIQFSAGESKCNVFTYDKNKKFISYIGYVNSFTTDSNTNFIRFYNSYANDLSINIQLEEGTVATPYEPYIEDKLTILSPVQLEKVGDVADRIIEKDGVLGVEKNVETRVLDGESLRVSSLLGDTTGEYIRYHIPTVPVKTINVATINVLSNKLQATSQVIIDTLQQESISSHSGGGVQLKLNKSKGTTVTEINNYLKLNNIIVKYNGSSQFIPLPHSQQVKLRTFANKTNISFLTEIEGTIKAQVPKSIGATVNTHTEQISNLNKELDRVKKLEESTVSTVTTESDFTAVEATSNGYFEDVKLEGKTLVNYISNFNNWSNMGSTTVSEDGASMTINATSWNKGRQISKSLPSGEYIFSINNPNNATIIVQNKTNAKTLLMGNNIDMNIKFSLLEVSEILITCKNTSETGTYVVNNPILTTDKNVNGYFEGLKSVGQSATTSEDVVDEISVKSIGENIVKYTNNRIEEGGYFCDFEPIFSSDVYYYNVSDKNVAVHVKNGSEYLRTIYIPPKSSIQLKLAEGESTYAFTLYLKDGWPKQVYDMDSICFVSSLVDKKRLLYYNEETQAWEKPILREGDSIEKHANGKYYYHQRSAEVVLNGSENTTISSANEGLLRFYIDKSDISVNGSVKSDRFNNILGTVSEESIYLHPTRNQIVIVINASKLPTQDVQGFKQWLQANNLTVVYQLAQEKVYECTNIDLITYANETNFIVESGALSPKTTLKVHSNISNVVSLLQKKVSLLESNIKASQEVQDMMILETDMRMLDIELALMEFAPMKLNLLGGSDMLRSATYFNFLKNHIINETYEKEYLENVMNKYLATGRINQDEYDELYKMLYPPVYDIELPIEY